MKVKKIIFVLVILIVLSIGWILSVRAISGVELRESQNELIEKADILASKELYIRSIPLYEKALSYSTDRNIEIEEKLLANYQAFEEYDSYINLVERRMERDNATEQEYLTASQYYINSGKIENAMALLKNGMKKFAATTIEDMYEANRYGYMLHMTDYTEIIPTTDNMLMPAFNGEKWGYINNKGRGQTEFKYDFVTPFNQPGYAVVLYNGSYYVITRSGDKYGIDETGITDVYSLTPNFILAQANGYYGYYNYDFQCVAPTHQYEKITANACGFAAVKKDGFWGIITDSGTVVVDFILEDVAINSLGSVYANNMAMVKTNGLWYLVDTKGNQISETGYANAKAPESNGYIAVANTEGMWGYIDQKGNLVIDFQYINALSFSQHLAAVQIGSNWGYISEKNKLVIEQFIKEAQPFHNGIAQVRFADGMGLLELEYFEE